MLVLPLLMTNKSCCRQQIVGGPTGDCRFLASSNPLRPQCCSQGLDVSCSNKCARASACSVLVSTVAVQVSAYKGLVLCGRAPVGVFGCL